MKRTISNAHLRPDPRSNQSTGAATGENSHTQDDLDGSERQKHEHGDSRHDCSESVQRAEQITLLNDSPDGSAWKHTKIRRLHEPNKPNTKTSLRTLGKADAEQTRQSRRLASRVAGVPTFPILGKQSDNTAHCEMETGNLHTQQTLLRPKLTTSVHGGANTTGRKAPPSLAMALMSMQPLESSQEGGIFEDLNVIVAHRDSHCACSECAEVTSLLHKHGDACVQRSLLQRKHQTLLSFLAESSTVIVVHKYAPYASLRTFLGLKPDTALAPFTLCSFSWVHECISRGSLLPTEQYKWNGPEDPPPPAVVLDDQNSHIPDKRSDTAADSILQHQAAATEAESERPGGAQQSSAAGHGVLSSDQQREQWAAAAERALRGHTKAAPASSASQPAPTPSLSAAGDGSVGAPFRQISEAWGRCGSRGGAALAQCKSWAGDGGELQSRLGHWSSGEDQQSSLERSEDEEALEAGTGSLAQALPESWVDRVKGRFLCGMVGGQGTEVAGAALKDALVERPNQELVQALGDLEEAYTALGDEWRKVAYKRAAAAVAKVEEELTIDNWREVIQKHNPRMRAIGASISLKIEEVLQTGRIQKLDLLKQDGAVNTLTDLSRVWGVGPALAAKLYKAGVRSVEELVGKSVVGEGRWQVALSYQAQMGALHFDDINTKIPRDEIRCIEEMVQRIAHRVGGPRVSVEACGSYRRGKAESGDVDCLLTRSDTGDLMELMGRLLGALAEACEMKHLSLPTKKSQHGGCSYMGLIRAHPASRFRRIDIKAYPREQRAFAQMHMTGSDHFNRSIRLFAMKKGLSLSDHGCCKVVRQHGHWGPKVMAGGNLRHCETERDIFELLHLDYVAPEDRHGGYTVAHLQAAASSGGGA